MNGGVSFISIAKEKVKAQIKNIFALDR